MCIFFVVRYSDLTLPGHKS